MAEDLQLLEVQDHSSISYQALFGEDLPTTLRFTGVVNGSKIQILIDGGSSHNFIQARAT